MHNPALNRFDYRAHSDVGIFRCGPLWSIEAILVCRQKGICGYNSASDTQTVLLALRTQYPHQKFTDSAVEASQADYQD